MDMDFLAKMLPRREWELHLRKAQSEEIGLQFAKVQNRNTQASERIANENLALLERLSQDQNRNDEQRTSVLLDAFERNSEILYDIRSHLDFGFRSLINHAKYQSQRLDEIVQLLKVPDRIKDARIHAYDAVRFYKGSINNKQLWNAAFEEIHTALEEVPRNPYVLELTGRIQLTRKDGKANPKSALNYFENAKMYADVEEISPKDLLISIGEFGAQAAYYCEEYDKAVMFSKIAYELDSNNIKHVHDYSRFLLIQGEPNCQYLSWNVLCGYLNIQNNHEYYKMLVLINADPYLVDLFSNLNICIKQAITYKELLLQTLNELKNIARYFTIAQKKYSKDIEDTLAYIIKCSKSNDIVWILRSIRMLPWHIKELKSIQEKEYKLLQTSISTIIDRISIIEHADKEYHGFVFSEGTILKTKNLLVSAETSLEDQFNYQNRLKDFAEEQDHNIRKYENMLKLIRHEDHEIYSSKRELESLCQKRRNKAEDSFDPFKYLLILGAISIFFAHRVSWLLSLNNFWKEAGPGILNGLLHLFNGILAILGFVVVPITGGWCIYWLICLIKLAWSNADLSYKIRSQETKINEAEKTKDRILNDHRIL